MSVLDKLARLRGVTWTWNDDAVVAGKQPGMRDGGVIAQEVEAEFPEFVTSSEGIKQVNYTALVGVLIEAVKELKTRNEILEARVSELEKLARARANEPAAK